MADLRAQRGLVFLIFSRVALLLIITAPWVYSALGFANYVSLLVLSVLISLVGIKPQLHPHLDRHEELLFQGPLLMCVFEAPDSEKKRESYSACEVIMSDQRILILETIEGQSVLLAQLRYPNDGSAETLPALRTWADFKIENVNLGSKTLYFQVSGDNDGSAHWGTSRVDLLFPEAEQCHALLQERLSVSNISDVNVGCPG